LGLKVFDAYRPQRAVDHFVRWAEDLADTRMKAEFYPGVDKENLFRDGFIAARSGHSRGSTVDLTIIDLASGAELDMGTPFDFFGPESWPGNPAMPALVRANRALLQRVMAAHGFRHLREEWWHFTLNGEPHPDTYFDFPVR
ncbi:MAG: M15 family metallopeptidase, partial [Desulfovibrionaceae bacterium]